MTDDLVWPDDLIAKYPLTFAGVWDFGCGEGWRKLLTHLCETIEPIIAAMPEGERVGAQQVKEKFGTLRFYMSGYVPEIEKAISAAEASSLVTCERCGAPGVLDSDRPYVWVTVKCPPCREAVRQEREQRERQP